MYIEHSLLWAIQDNPDDDVAWLVLADWLEEQGQTDRADLLRLHRALRDLDEGSHRDQLEARVQALLLAGVRPWVPILINSVGVQLVLIPKGRFWLGSPEDEDGRYNDETPRRPVAMTKPFYLGVFPVTQEEYERVMGHNPSAFMPTGRLADVALGLNTRRHPVEQVSWYDAQAFCKRLSDLPGERQHGRHYRLPTEAEWEYACRGGAGLCSPFPWGKAMSTDYANYRVAPRVPGANPRHTTPVDAYLPNGFGLYDMLGNTWEWCGDWYASDAYTRNPDADPPGPREGVRRNARGGTYNLETRRVRSADRSSFDPAQKDSDLSFRVLCEWRPAP